MPPFIAFSNDQHYYTYFDSFPGSVHSNFIDASVISVPLFPMAQTSCLTALFFEHRQAVKDLCPYKVKVNSISTSIQYVENSRYLIANTTELFLSCPNGRKRQAGCQFCVMTIPCQCDVTTVNTYFPPRLNDCYEDEVSALHPVNLAVLMHLKELSQLNHIPASAAYAEVPNSLMLNVKLFSHNFTKFVAEDSNKVLSLGKVVNSVKEGKYVFRSLAEPILDQLLDNDKDFDYFSWNAIVMYVDSGVLIIVCICIFYILIRMNRLNAHYVALASVGKVRSLQLFSTTTTTTSPTPHVVTEVDNSILYAILTLGIVTLLFIAYKYIIRKMRHASVALEITDGHRCVVVPLVSIPFCPKFYHVKTEQNFSNFKVVGYVRPSFMWQPGSLVISHLLDGTMLHIPVIVNMSWWDAIKLRKILSKPFYAYLICQHANHAYHMKICPMNCSYCQVILNTTEIPEIKKPLYPALMD